MLTNSFLLLDGVGQTTEHNIWEQGIHSWDEYIQKETINGIGDARKSKHHQFLDKAQQNLERSNRAFFKYQMPQSQYWRLYREFKDSIGYIDIETTGLDKQRNSITTISIYDGNDTTTLINGQDLTADNLQRELNEHAVLTSFNGARFDIPFIKANFPSIQIDHPHIDLMYPCKKLGLTGDLKSIEHELGISRGDLDGVDGKEAVRLWKQYQNGDQTALERLVKYNQEDVINLQQLLTHVYQKLKHRQFERRIA